MSESESENDVDHDNESNGDQLLEADARLAEVSSLVVTSSSEDEHEGESDNSQGIADVEEDEDGDEPRRSHRERRSTTKYVNYQDNQSSGEGSGSEGSDKGVEEDSNGGEPKIEKFIGRKPCNKALLKKVMERNEEYTGSFTYLCKYKGMSYLHVKWVHEDELREMDWRISTKVQRYINKVKVEEEERAEESSWCEFYEEIQRDGYEYFASELTDIDRILAEKKEIFEEESSGSYDVDVTMFTYLNGNTEKEHKFQLDFSDLCINQEELLSRKVLRTLYYVKWSGQSYSECTWEFAHDIKDDISLALFRRRNRPPIGLTDGGKNTFESSKMTELNTALWPALSNTSSISPIMRIWTKAKVPLRIPKALSKLLMQGEGNEF